MPTMKEMILDCLDDGPATSDEIAQETNLTVNGVSSVLNQLRHEGMVEPTGRVRKHKGRVSWIWDYRNLRHEGS